MGVSLCNESISTQVQLSNEENISLIKRIGLDKLFNGGLKSDDICKIDSDCTDRYHCDLDNNKCKRDPIFPMRLVDYFGLLTLALLMALAIAAGLGGGDIIVPIIKIIFQFVQSEASRMSQYCIFMACIARFIVNYNKKHPYRDAVPIDYKVTTVLLPCIFLGVSIGVMFRSMVPNFIQEILLVFVILFCMKESLFKGIKYWKQETLEKAKAGQKLKPIKDKIQIVSSDSARLLEEDGNFSDSHDTSLQTPEANKIFIKQLEKKDKSHWQFDKLFPIWFILIALIMQSMIKDSDIFGVSTCSAIYWIVYILYILLCIVTMIFAVFMLNKDMEYREKIGFPDYRGNVKYPLNKIIILAGISCMAGLMSSVIGIGGSQFYIPMLLILGYPPFVASSTSIFLVMNASFANSISYTIRGEINVYNGLWYGMWTAAGVIIGVTTSNIVVKKTGRQSIFLFLLVFVLILSLVFTILFNTINLVDEINNGHNIFEISNPCDK